MLIVAGSIAWATSVPPTPLIFACVSRSDETASTPGTLATVGPTAAGIGEKPSSWRTAMLPASVRSIRSSIEERRPLANTVTKTTSASPIISAAEVTAVRPGWRVEFSRASRPTSLVERSMGTAMKRAAGRTKRGEIIAMPRIRITAPPAAPSSLVEVSPPLASRPATTSPAPMRTEGRRATA